MKSPYPLSSRMDGELYVDVKARAKQDFNLFP